MSVRSVEKFVGKSLSFLEVPVVRYARISALVLYMTGIAPELTEPFGNLLASPWVRLVVLMAVVYLGHKDALLSLLLLSAFIMTAQSNDMRRVSAVVGGSASAAQQLLGAGFGGAMDV